MRKAKSLLGLNILSQHEGKNLGTVRDLVFDFEAHKLLALVLTDRDLFGLKDATVIAWNQVGEIGPNAVMVPSDDVVLNAHTDAIIAEAFDQKKTLDGKKVTTQSGEDLGRVSDLYLDEAGYVTGFEVSGGLFADIGTGKRYMEIPQDITVGEDVILVPQSVATALEQQKQSEPGGLTATYQGAATSASGAYDNLADASV
ncbi:MAG TPA: PRC-barrel domain-containing protein, partial [Abditibacterium sp.]